MILEFVGDLIKSTGSEFFYEVNFALQVYGSASFLTQLMKQERKETGCLLFLTA